MFVAQDCNAISLFSFFFSCHSLDFSTLYTKFDLADLRALMRVLINKVFNWTLKLHHFKFVMVQVSALNVFVGEK